ncbi:nuclear transport factor 2 family protein [Mycolicibacterium sp. P9-22]|uniref:nuclear transport factor 2 family protein n=1 Tax=Mycolicibacterium sp. P9-22 TaxID=2024613 RepID=UPI001D15A6CF|nr:nuclear transport factor 2 family protein [Mycolicibacterium sp. P9-22]
MHRAEHGRAERPAQRRVLCAAIALGAVATLGVGAAPIAHAAPAAATPPAVSPLAAAADADADRAAVQLLKATYFNNVDSKNWLALRQLFAPNAVVDTTGSLGPYFPNRDLFVAFTALTLSAINTRHLGYDPQIELTSDTTAGAVWTMQDRLSIAGLVTIHGYGHYTDSYEKVDGQWRVTHSKLTRTGFELELPAFTNFATGFADAYKSGGPVAALLYIVPGIVNIPVSIVQNLLGAVASNFGGPPAKAEPITPPPGSTDVTTELPGLTTAPPAVTTGPASAATAAPSAKTVTLRTTVAASSDSGATPLATDTVDSTTKPVRTIEADATQKPVESKPRPSTTTPPEALDTDTEDATSATETTAETAADEDSRTPKTAPSHDDSTGSPSTSHDGAGPGSSDDAKSEAGSSGGSQQ